MHAIATNDAFALTASWNIESVKDELTRDRRNRKQQQPSPVLHLCLCQQLPDKNDTVRSLMELRNPKQWFLT